MGNLCGRSSRHDNDNPYGDQSDPQANPFSPQADDSESAERERTNSFFERRGMNVIKFTEFKSKDRVCSVIGEGAYGVVYKMEYARSPVAVKCFKLPRTQLLALTEVSERAEDMEESWREVDILQKAQNSRVVQMMGICLDPPQGTLAVVMAFAGDSLQGLLERAFWQRKSAKGYKPLPNLDPLQIAQDIAEGMAFLHHVGILHRDLKSSNVFLDSVHGVKIGDLGLSRILQDGQSHVQHEGPGNPLWLAPETLDWPPCYSKASDVYAFGVIMWELLTWRLPWFRWWEEMQEDIGHYATPPAFWARVVKEVCDHKAVLPLPGDTTPAFDCQDWPGARQMSKQTLQQYASLVRKCCAHNAEQRPGFAEVFDTLKSLKEQRLRQRTSAVSQSV